MPGHSRCITQKSQLSEPGIDAANKDYFSNPGANSKNILRMDSEVFEKGLAGGGWRQTPKRAQKVLQKCAPILLRGHRKKGTEKRPKSLGFEGFLA